MDHYSRSIGNAYRGGYGIRNLGYGGQDSGDATTARGGPTGGALRDAALRNVSLA
ncbi:hypothetical protein GCM10008949_38540 [Deinococcus humi]|nr:hypothetical protein GCM10008949_38540 [Deinococcus humi]